MRKEKKNLLHEIKKEASGNIGEHLLKIFKAAAATTPFCGGIASLMSDYIPSGKFQRLEEFAKQIAKDLGELSNRIDEKITQTDDFAFIFEQCFRGVAENYQKEKLEAFRAILINSALAIDYSQNEKEFFLSLVNRLTVLHIQILKFATKPCEYLEENNIPKEKIQGGFSSFFPIAIPGVSLEVIKSAFSELHQYGLLNTQVDIFHTTTAAQGLQLLGDRSTELAKKFIDFCTLKS